MEKGSYNLVLTVSQEGRYGLESVTNFQSTLEGHVVIANGLIKVPAVILPYKTIPLLFVHLYFPHLLHLCLHILCIICLSFHHLYLLHLLYLCLYLLYLSFHLLHLLRLSLLHLRCLLAPLGGIFV